MLQDSIVVDLTHRSLPVAGELEKDVEVWSRALGNFGLFVTNPFLGCLPDLREPPSCLVARGQDLTCDCRLLLSLSITATTIINAIEAIEGSNAAAIKRG